MKRYILHQFPVKPRTYIALLLAILFTVIVITFFIEITDYAQLLFKQKARNYPLLSLIITPITYVGIIYFTKLYFQRAESSGIPQVIATLDSRNKKIRQQLLSFKAALAKFSIIFLGMLGGAPIGIQGPSIYIGSSIFYSFNRFIHLKRKIMIHSMIILGGCAGLIVAFNAPIAGFFFAYEELGRKIRSQALIFIAFGCGVVYLIATVYRGNLPYLKDLSGLLFEYTLIWQLIPLAIIAGLLGGLFSIILVFLIDKFTFNTAKKILATSIIIGIIVGLFNYFSEFLISGSGKQEVMFMLDSQSLGVEFILMKYFSVLTSVTSAIPGGLFLPTISIGMGIGSEASNLMPLFEPQVVMIMATIAYLSGAIRTPLTATFVTLEMTSTMHLILPALMVAFIANYVSRLIKKQPLYETMADNYIKITNP